MLAQLSLAQNRDPGQNFPLPTATLSPGFLRPGNQPLAKATDFWRGLSPCQVSSHSASSGLEMGFRKGLERTRGRVLLPLPAAAPLQSDSFLGLGELCRRLFRVCRMLCYVLACEVKLNSPLKIRRALAEGMRRPVQDLLQQRLRRSPPTSCCQ